MDSTYDRKGKKINVRTTSLPYKSITRVKTHVEIITIRTFAK